MIAVDVPVRESDVVDGRVSVVQLRTSFVFDGFDVGDSVDDRRWWPVGPKLVMQFDNLSQMLRSAPQMTVSDLRSVASKHEVVLPRRCCKHDMVAHLDSHFCAGCRQLLLFRFRALACARPLSQPAQVFDGRDGNDLFLGPEEGTDSLIVSIAKLSQCRFVGVAAQRSRDNRGSIFVRVPIPQLCHLLNDRRHLESVADAHLVS